MRKGLLVLVTLLALAGAADASFYDNPTSVYGQWIGSFEYTGLISGTQTGTFTLGGTETFSFVEPYYLFVPPAFPPDNWTLADNEYLSNIQGSASAGSPTTLGYSAVLNAVIDTGSGVFTLTNALLSTLFTFNYDGAGNALSMTVLGTLTDSSGSFTLAAASGTFSPTPIPGAIWLLGSGVLGLFGMRKKFASV